MFRRISFIFTLLAIVLLVKQVHLPEAQYWGVITYASDCCKDTSKNKSCNPQQDSKPCSCITVSSSFSGMITEEINYDFQPKKNIQKPIKFPISTENYKNSYIFDIFHPPAC